MSKLDLKVKHKKSSTPHNSRRKNLLILFLCTALLISSSLALMLSKTSIFASATSNAIEVNNEIDLREAVENAEPVIPTVIVFNVDIQLTGTIVTDAPLTISADKDRVLSQNYFLFFNYLNIHY